MAEQSVEALVAIATRDDSDAAWAAVSAMHKLGTADVLRAARELAEQPEELKRVRAADIAAQLGIPERTFPEACLSLVLGLMTGPETEAAVVAAGATALGHLRTHLSQGQQRLVLATLLEITGHPEPDVRFAVTYSLSGIDEAQALAALCMLSADGDPDVRNWATFGLGSLTELDTPSIRDALAARLTDEGEETRGEAIIGLARRGDPRAEPAVRAALEAQERIDPVLEAAALLGIPVGDD